MSNTSRRDLLKGAALAGLGSVPNARGASVGPPPKDENGSHWEMPAAQKGNNLNLIILVSATFRADNLAAYGSEWVDTPNLNRFAENAVIFEDAYPEGLPTIHIRRTLYTGRRIVPRYYYYQHEPVQIASWHHLYNEDVTLAETLHELLGYLEQGEIYRPVQTATLQSKGRPQELANVADKHSAVVKDLHGKLERYIASGWEITCGSFNEKAG